MSVFVDNPPTTTVLTVDSIRTDGGTQPRINQDWAIIGEYAQDMLNGDKFPPVIVFFDGIEYWLADGFHRYHATIQAGKETITSEVRYGMQRDAILYSVSANSNHGFRRKNEDKRSSVMKLLNDAEWAKWSDSEVARRTATSHDLVRRLRPLSILHSMQDTERLVERNGTIYTMNTTGLGISPTTGDGPGFSPMYSNIERIEADYAQRRDEILRQREEAEFNRDGIPIATPHISSKNNEWYTPLKYINAAKKLMGGIDLDPASCEQANETVAATQYYHINKSGLAHDWFERVWLNPPYGYTNGESNQALWSNRLIDQYANRNIIEAVLLVNAAVDTHWFQRLFDYPVCITRGRINFSTPETSTSGSTHGSAFVYFGSEEKHQAFREIFSEFGRVVKGW